MNQDQAKLRAENPRLDSWKQIASYLGCEERTAKRWEGTRGLPVHRLPGVRSGVFAYVREIEKWQKQNAAPTVDVHPVVTEEKTEAQPVHTTEAPPQKFTLLLSSWLSFKSPQIAIAASLLIAGLAYSPFLLAHRLRVSGAHSEPLKATSRSVVVHVPPKEAENLYLKGRYFWNKRTASDLESALGLFKQAVERDPDYASAYIGLADTYSLLVEYAGLPPSEAYPPAIAAAKQAIALNPSLPEAHRSLAFSSFYWSWDRALSEQEFRKAIALDPHDATSHHWFANTLMSSQRFDEAMAENEEARRLDPGAISILADHAHIQWVEGHKQEGRAEMLQIAKAEPLYIPVHWYLATAAYEDRDFPTYLDELKRVAAMSHRDVDMKLYTAAEKGFAAAGEKGMVDALAEAELDLFRRGEVPAFDVVDPLAKAGKTKEAIQYLKLAYQNRDTQFLTIAAPNVLPMLRSDPEFKELAEMSVAPYQEHAQMAELSRNDKMRLVSATGSPLK